MGNQTQKCRTKISLSCCTTSWGPVLRGAAYLCAYACSAATPYFICPNRWHQHQVDKQGKNGLEGHMKMNGISSAKWPTAKGNGAHMQAGFCSDQRRWGDVSSTRLTVVQLGCPRMLYISNARSSSLLTNLQRCRLRSASQPVR